MVQKTSTKLYGQAKEYTMTDEDLSIQLKELKTLVSNVISTVSALQRRVKNLEDEQVEEVPKLVVADSPQGQDVVYRMYARNTGAPTKPHKD